MLFRRFAVLCLSCLCLIQNLSAADRVPELLKLLPDNVNSISIIRIDELMKSERAVKEQWKDKQEADFLVGSGRIPSWVGTLVRGPRFMPWPMDQSFRRVLHLNQKASA